MYKLSSTLFAFVLSMITFCTFAGENMTKFDNLEVHHIGLSTAILQPDIAKSYNIERSRYRGFINIAVLDSNKGSKPISVGISGTATNLVGQRISLSFDEIKEGDAIYYLATISYPNDETYTFDILINDNGKEHNLKFVQKFYIEQ